MVMLHIPNPLLLLPLNLITAINIKKPFALLQMNARLRTSVIFTLKWSYTAAILQAAGEQTFNIPISSFENVQWNQSKSHFHVQKLLWLIYSTFGSCIFPQCDFMSFFHRLKCRFAHILLHSLGGEKGANRMNQLLSLLKINALWCN